MAQFAVNCGCGRSMTPYGRAGRNAFRCGCGARIQVLEQRTQARRCTFGECRTLATTAEPLKFCPEHQEQAATLLAHTAGQARIHELEEALGRSPQTWNRRYGFGVTPLPKNINHAPLVYFARREHLIKIGWTSQLTQRMKNIATQALATEPGDLVRERQIHRQFGHLLADRREWFRPGPDLIAYINELRQADGLPEITATSSTEVTLTEPRYPLEVVLLGGRVHHSARFAGDGQAVITLCGQRGVPTGDGSASRYCRKCAHRPNPTNQRFYAA